MKMIDKLLSKWYVPKKEYEALESFVLVVDGLSRGNGMLQTLNIILKKGVKNDRTTKTIQKSRKKRSK